MNKANILTAAALILSGMLFSGCQAIGEIFKAGMWSGILIVIFVVALVLYFISKAGKKSD